MLQLSSTDALLDAIAGARNVSLQSYTLSRPVVDALEAAARRGAHVAVELDGNPHDDRADRLKSENARLVAEMRGAGVDATSAPEIHAKACRVDGSLFLDEKNWRSGDIVLRDDDAADAASIPTTKHEALAQEARLLDRAAAGDAVIVESESFGAGNAVYNALKALGLAGASPRLLVTKRVLSGNRRERSILEDLVRDGVRVRVCKDSSKLAIAGDQAWLGSANATIAFPAGDMTDWGLCTANSAIVATVRDRLETQWQTAKEFRCQRA
jgi:phosphatidylserine/phosphatidylglycerophosphate/cardiolipin synthase-like enzyme